MTEALALDEMFGGHIAAALRERGHDVITLVSSPELRGLPDPEVLAWATSLGRRLVTENVKDFRPLLAPASGSSVLFVSSRRFSRGPSGTSRLVDALDGWLQRAAERPLEDWLTA